MVFDLFIFFSAFEHLRKKIELQNEKIRTAKLKEEQAKKVRVLLCLHWWSMLALVVAHQSPHPSGPLYAFFFHYHFYWVWGAHCWSTEASLLSTRERRMRAFNCYMCTNLCYFLLKVAVWSLTWRMMLEKHLYISLRCYLCHLKSLNLSASTPCLCCINLISGIQKEST